MRTPPFFGSLLWLLLLGPVATAAGPKAITKVPFEIKTPGRYVLSRSVALAAPATPNPALTAAIVISCDDVVLDLGENILTCDSTLGITTDVAGVRADNRKNLTIRNGTVRGFARGIYLEGIPSTSGSHLVEALHADRCTFVGIQVSGAGSCVRKNRISSVGGAAFVTVVRYGIFSAGTGSRILDNEIHGVTPSDASQNAYGIYLESGDGSAIQGNRVTNPVGPAGNGLGSVTGIFPSFSSAVISGNFLSLWRRGISVSGSGNTVGIYRDNTAVKCDVNYVSGAYTDGGGNK